MSTIPSWYAEKNIFITGGTGFLGICLIEKLLRTIPDIGTIYIMLRPKRGKAIEQRLEELKKNAVFERLKSEKSNFDEVFKKVTAIAGDVGEENLGISPEDRAILTENVNVFFHSAATLDFAETLKTTVDINLLGTRRCLQLAKECRKVEAFVQVSSAYVNSWRLEADEIIYPLTANVEEMIRLTQTLSPEELEAKTPEIIGDHPNTYTITKHMAEHEVQKCEALFPCTIVRPSMITTSWKEPMPGWTMSKNGPQGFIMGASRGVLRRLPVGKELIYDYIPVDIVVNALIAAAYHAGVMEAKTVEVYHCTSSTCNPFRWASVEERINGMLHRYPLMSAVWYPHLKLLSSVQHFKISAFFIHIIPAFFLDFITRVTGGRPILMKLHRNVNTSLTRLEKFIFTEWLFTNIRIMDLQNWLRPIDQHHYNLDVSTLSWPEYFEDLAQGVRQYLSKESMKNIQAARGKDTLLMVIHLAFQSSFYGLIWYIFACIIGTTMTKSAMIVPIAYMLFSLL